MDYSFLLLIFSICYLFMCYSCVVFKLISNLILFVYFFKEYIISLFNSVGFKEEDLRYDTRELRNRKRKINMYRVWICGKFIKQ